MENPLHSTEFYRDGRGPTLERVHWVQIGAVLGAIDYLNPDAAGAASLRHVRFIGVQVVLITPEEVINYSTFGDHLSQHRPAAMFDLGRSPWLSSFAPRHLAKCRHIQLMFCDELFDVICEGVTCHHGGYVQ